VLQEAPFIAAVSAEIQIDLDEARLIANRLYSFKDKLIETSGIPGNHLEEGWRPS
jgi:hypothetical protein